MILSWQDLHYKNNLHKIKLFSFKTFIFLFLFSSAKAQENYFKVSAQYRVRPEFRNGYKTLSTDSSKAAFFVTQRARLIFDYKKDNLQVYTSIQDIRTWGDEEQSKDIPGLAVNELWLELNLKKGFSLKMGRQELIYDDQRLLGNADWSNATRSHDALLLKYINKEKKLNWHIGGAFNQSGEPLFGTDYQLKNYKFLAFSWFKKEFGNNSLSATAIVNGLNATVPLSKKTFTSFTFGPLYNYKNNKFKALLGAYYQKGNTENNLLLNAYMINAYAELRGKIFAGLGLDYLSGDDDNTPSNHSNSFSTLYATNHKFYGSMDYFVNIPADTKQRGLIDPYLRLGLISNKKVTTTVDVHYFLLAHENSLSVNKLKRNLGTEIDALIDYKPSPVINFLAGTSILFATKNMELIKGGNKNNYNGWAFIMLKVSPTFLLKEF
ncbi:MAG: alginate export family protein [Chitinophagaceae bacterium]|nr:alginate export family protein [Chitinophagaceae bacterium]